MRMSTSIQSVDQHRLDCIQACLDCARICNTCGDDMIGMDMSEDEGPGPHGALHPSLPRLRGHLPPCGAVDGTDLGLCRSPLRVLCRNV